MDNPEFRIMQAIKRTRVIRLPRQKLATFGITNLKYYLVTEPSYREIVKGEQESVIREGRVTAERPAIVTPTYMLNLEGFGPDARKYMEYMAERFGPNSPGLLYSYKNEFKDMNIVGGDPLATAHRISDDLDRRDDDASFVILGVDEFWDISLIMSTYEITAASLRNNVEEFNAMGLLNPDPELGVPRAAIQNIEGLFRDAEHGGDPELLKRELDRWELFDGYQDRFLGLFRRRRGL